MTWTQKIFLCKSAKETNYSHHQWSCPSSKSWLCEDQRRFSAWWCSSLWNITGKFGTHSGKFCIQLINPWWNFGKGFTNVFERPSVFHQVSQWMFHYAGSPLVDFALVIVQPSNHTFDALRRNQTQDEVTFTTTVHQRRETLCIEGAWNGKGTSLTEVLASSALNAAWKWKRKSLFIQWN